MLGIMKELAGMVEDMGLGVRNTACKFARETENARYSKNEESSGDSGVNEKLLLNRSLKTVAMAACRASGAELKKVLSGKNLKEYILTIKAISPSEWTTMLANEIVEYNTHVSKDSVTETLKSIYGNMDTGEYFESQREDAEAANTTNADTNNLEIGIKMIRESNPKLAEVMEKAAKGEISEEEVMREIKRNGKITLDISAFFDDTVASAIKKSEPEEETKKNIGHEKKNLSIVEALQSAKVGEKLFDKLSTPSESPA